MAEYQEDHYIWNPLAILFFIGLMVGVFLWLSESLWFVSGLTSLSFFDLTVLALATLRLVRLFTYDKIMGFFRQLFLDKGNKPERGIRRLCAELIECVWCTGMWGALVVSALYFSGLFGEFVVYILAISALGTVFLTFTQMLSRIGQK